MNKKSLAELIERIKDNNPLAITFDGLDKAIIGIGGQYGKEQLVIYSATKIVEVLVKGGMATEEAIEYYNFNIESLWAGEMTPIIMDDF